MYAADENFLETVLKGLEIEVIPDRDAFDYLYLRKDLAELAGNRFHKKKNRINYLLKRYEVGVEHYAPEHLEQALQLLDEWRRIRSGSESPSLLLEVEAAAEALRMAPSLGLQGVVAMVDGKLKGLVLGEKLNDDTAVCHFEKGDVFLEGLYQLLDRDFSRLCFTECTFVNREQDLGEQNLREAKLSYHPVELVKKFRVRKGVGATRR
jgi:hypothetical protein